MDVHTKAVRSYNMSHIKARDTKPEVKVRKYLFSQGLRFRKNDRRFPGVPDIVLPKYKTMVFINGCFWHVHNCKYFSLPKTNRDFWLEKLENNKKRDKLIYLKNQNMGWKIIVIWQCEIKGDLFVHRMEQLIQQIVS